MSPKYLTLTEELFAWLANAGNSAITSTVSFTELLVPGYHKGNQSRIDAFYSLLTDFPNLSFCPVTLDVADFAARLRSSFRLKTPDAIQAATATTNGATAFLTNDSAFKGLKQLEVAVLDDLL